jgi:NAD(P)-dependent dehydrogenase (short-subunit alcohol dehydrogenase family)
VPHDHPPGAIGEQQPRYAETLDATHRNRRPVVAVDVHVDEPIPEREVAVQQPEPFSWGQRLQEVVHDAVKRLTRPESLHGERKAGRRVRHGVDSARPCRPRHSEQRLRSFALFGRWACRPGPFVVADLGGQLDGTGSSSEPAAQVVKETEAEGGTAVSCSASVATEEGADAIIRTALDAFGGVDVIINNAGISEPDWFDDLTVDRFRQMIDVHYLGSVNVIRAAWPHLRSNGYGRIVNMCSEAAFGMVPKNTSYGGAKGGVFGLTRSLALDARRHGILVNAVAPERARECPIRRFCRACTTRPRRCSQR